MSKPTTYVDSQDGVDLSPTRTRLLFAAVLSHGPGFDEQIEYRVGPSECGRFDVLWITGDWDGNGMQRNAGAWLPRHQLSGKVLHLVLLESLWEAERRANGSSGPNFGAIMRRKSALLAAEEVREAAARVFNKSEGDQTDTERCPICCTLNHPGACETCGHFFGSVWDGDIIWSADFDAFDEIWRQLVGVVSDLSPPALQTIRKAVAFIHVVAKILKLAHLEETSAGAVQQLVHFQEGPVVVTGGMLSGKGHSLYLKNSAEFRKVLNSCRKLLRLATKLR